VSGGGTSIQGFNGQTTKPYSQVLLWSAEAKALGFIPANQSGVDGFAGFATDINSNSLIGVALHELTHALGRANAGLPLSFGDIPDIFDLFRFDSANNTRLVDGDFGSAPPAYFSVSGGGTVLANYGQTSDPSDFLR
jgi:serralysin